MLARLRLPLDQAIKYFGKLTKDVFSNRKYLSTSGSSTFKSNRMQQALKEIIREAVGDENEKMMDHGPNAGKCKT
jgi:hypothetical protein